MVNYSHRFAFYARFSWGLFHNLFQYNHQYIDYNFHAVSTCYSSNLCTLTAEYFQWKFSFCFLLTPVKNISLFATTSPRFPARLKAPPELWTLLITKEPGYGWLNSGSKYVMEMLLITRQFSLFYWAALSRPVEIVEILRIIFEWSCSLKPNKHK
jgi:hypothetical protein